MLSMNWLLEPVGWNSLVGQAYIKEWVVFVPPELHSLKVQSQAMNLVWLLLVLGLGSLSKRKGCCLFERIYEPRPAIHMEKALLTAWLGPLVGWGGASGSLQGEMNSVSQVDVVSEMAPAYQLCGSTVGWVQKRTNVLCLPFCLGESFPHNVFQIISPSVTFIKLDSVLIVEERNGHELTIFVAQWYVNGSSF